jgi:hypothetical protein
MNLFRFLGEFFPSERRISLKNRDAIHRRLVSSGIYNHTRAQDSNIAIMPRSVRARAFTSLAVHSLVFWTISRLRHLIQNTSIIRPRFPNPIPRPVLELCFALQLHHEALLHRKQLLYTPPHAVSLQERYTNLPDLPFANFSA